MLTDNPKYSCFTDKESSNSSRNVDRILFGHFQVFTIPSRSAICFNLRVPIISVALFVMTAEMFTKNEPVLFVYKLYTFNTSTATTWSGELYHVTHWSLYGLSMFTVS